MARVLLFQCENKETEIRQILTRMQIRAVNVPVQQFHKTLGELEKDSAVADSSADGDGFAGECPQGSLLVMCDFTEKQMNRLLTELRSHGIYVDYKAALTPTNRNWDVLHIYREMRREKMMYEQMEAQRLGKIGG